MHGAQECFRNNQPKVGDHDSTARYLQGSNFSKEIKNHLFDDARHLTLLLFVDRILKS